jgi:hypothetical protein
MSVYGAETVLAVAFLDLRSRKAGFPAAAPLIVDTVPLRSIPSFYEKFRMRLAGMVV